MLIATLSDIHIDFAQNREMLVKAATAIWERKPDLLIVAGDISHRNEHIQKALRALKEIAPKVAYIPGNHDLWYEVPWAPARDDLNTWDRYRTELRELAEAEGAHYLPAAPLYLGAVAIAGTCGWYDYSCVLPEFRDQIGPEALQSKSWEGAMWSDVRFIAFRDAQGALMSDPQVAQQMESELASQIDEADARSDVDHIVAVTHHLPFSQVVRRSHSMPWEFFNAFMGSNGLGAAIQRSSKVHTAVYGHTHFYGRETIDGVEVFGAPMGYPKERKNQTEAQVLQTRIGWIEL